MKRDGSSHHGLAFLFTLFKTIVNPVDEQLATRVLAPRRREERAIDQEDVGDQDATFGGQGSQLYLCSGLAVAESVAGATLTADTRASAVADETIAWRVSAIWLRTKITDAASNASVVVAIATATIRALIDSVLSVTFMNPVASLLDVPSETRQFRAPASGAARVPSN